MNLKREQVVLRRLHDGEIVALISDAGTPGISDPGMELAKLCVDKDIPVIPVPGPSAVVAALLASGLPTNEFTFGNVSLIGKSPNCMKSWRGTLEEAKEAFSSHQPKGEITLMIEGTTNREVKVLSESQLENELGELMSKGCSLSAAVKLVASETAMKRKAIYSLALEKFRKRLGSDDIN